MIFKLTHIADVPDVVTNAVGIGVRVIHFIAGNFFAHGNAFQHRTVAEPTTAYIISLVLFWILVKMPEQVYQVPTVNVIPHLLAFVTKNGVRLFSNGTLHQVGKKTM